MIAVRLLRLEPGGLEPGGRGRLECSIRKSCCCLSSGQLDSTEFVKCCVDPTGRMYSTAKRGVLDVDGRSLAGERILVPVAYGGRHGVRVFLRLET
jgi:hypothetical protein